VLLVRLWVHSLYCTKRRTIYVDIITGKHMFLKNVSKEKYRNILPSYNFEVTIVYRCNLDDSVM